LVGQKEQKITTVITTSIVNAQKNPRVKEKTACDENMQKAASVTAVPLLRYQPQQLCINHRENPAHRTAHKRPSSTTDGRL